MRHRAGSWKDLCRGSQSKLIVFAPTTACCDSARLGRAVWLAIFILTSGRFGWVQNLEAFQAYKAFYVADVCVSLEDEKGIVVRMGKMESSVQMTKNASAEDQLHTARDR